MKLRYKIKWYLFKIKFIRKLRIRYLFTFHRERTINNLREIIKEALEEEGEGVEK